MNEPLGKQAESGLPRRIEIPHGDATGKISVIKYGLRPESHTVQTGDSRRDEVLTMATQTPVPLVALPDASVNAQRLTM